MLIASRWPRQGFFSLLTGGESNEAAIRHLRCEGLLLLHHARQRPAARRRGQQGARGRGARRPGRECARPPAAPVRVHWRCAREGADGGRGDREGARPRRSIETTLTVMVMVRGGEGGGSLPTPTSSWRGGSRIARMPSASGRTCRPTRRAAGLWGSRRPSRARARISSGALRSWRRRLRRRRGVGRCTRY